MDFPDAPQLRECAVVLDKRDILKYEEKQKKNAFLESVSLCDLSPVPSCDTSTNFQDLSDPHISMAFAPV
nr:unnamed protein product [Spirometra erinaceieuropaei]